MISLLRQLVFHDYLLKVISLALAVLVWVIINFASQKEGSPVGSLTLATKERTFPKLPVMVVFTAEDVRTSKVNPCEVEVTVLGDPRILRNLQSKDIRVMVDLTGIEAAHLRKRVEVSTPAGVAPTHVNPPEVEITIPPRVKPGGD